MAQRRRVLLVEDDPLVATLFMELLPDHNIELVCFDNAEDGRDAFDSASGAASFDLVISDKNLPGITGVQLLKHIKEHKNPAKREIDIIIMTAYADIASVLSSLHTGAFDYLVKPFESIDVVVQKIEQALEKRRITLENRRLLADLKRANTRIEAMNHTLEKQIQDRTQDLRDSNGKLELLTLTDDVTGLYNQRFLYQRLEEELLRDRRYQNGLAIIMLDVDKFKQVNDAHDHLFGSRVLNRIGLVLRDCIRTTDLPVRYGGDEFVVILPNTRLRAAVGVAQRVRESVANFDMSDNDATSDREDGRHLVADPFFVTVSIGVASQENDPDCEARELLRLADRGLYAAKQGGRNQVVCYSLADELAEDPEPTDPDPDTGRARDQAAGNSDEPEANTYDGVRRRRNSGNEGDAGNEGNHADARAHEPTEESEKTQQPESSAPKESDGQEDTAPAEEGGPRVDFSAAG